MVDTLDPKEETKELEKQVDIENKRTDKLKKQVIEKKTLKQLEVELKETSNKLLEIETDKVKATEKEVVKLKKTEVLLKKKIQLAKNQNTIDKNNLEIRSGMKSLAFEIEKSTKRQNTTLNEGLTLKTRQVMAEEVMAGNKADVNTELGKEAIFRGKVAKVAWEAQERLNEEIANGTVTERTRNELMSEYLEGLGLQTEADLGKDQLERVNMYMGAIANATEKWSQMSAQDIDILNEKNKILQEMGQKWDRVGDSVKEITNTVGALLSDPRIAGSIFGFQVLKRIGKMGEAFGSILETGISVENLTGGIAQNMSSAYLSSMLYGASMQEVADATKSIMETMGSIDYLTKENIKGAVKLMKFYGMDASSASQITKQFTHIGKSTGQTQNELRLSVVSMANLGKVAPTKIFEDLASNAEAIARWTDGSDKNMQKLAVSSRQLGLNMGDTLGITEGILDFETSIEKQMQASVMTGKSFNFEQARMLAFAGDHEGALKNIVSQLGTEHEFLQMNMYQRQAMADMLGTSVENLRDMVINQEKLGKATGTFSSAMENAWQYGTGMAKTVFTKDNLVWASSFFGTMRGLGPVFKNIGLGAKGFFNEIKSGFEGTKKLATSFASTIKNIFTKQTGDVIPEGYRLDKAGKLRDLKGRFASKDVLKKSQDTTSKVADMKVKDEVLAKTKSGTTGEVTKVDKSGGKGGIAGWIKSWDGVKWTSLAKIATALAIIGIAIYGFGKVIATLPTEPAQYLAAGVMMVGLVSSIWALSRIAGKIDMKGVVQGALAMTIVGAALIPFAYALKLMEGINWKTLAIAGTALVGITAAVMGLGALMATGVGALVFGAGIIALISLSGALLMFGTALGVISEKAAGVNYLASSLSMLAQSMQELAGVNSNLNDIKPVLKTIHKIETAFEPTKKTEPAVVTTTETKSQPINFDELIEQIKLLRKDVQAGMNIDGKKISRAIANVTGN